MRDGARRMLLARNLRALGVQTPALRALRIQVHRMMAQRLSPGGPGRWLLLIPGAGLVLAMTTVVATGSAPALGAAGAAGHAQAVASSNQVLPGEPGQPAGHRSGSSAVAVTPRPPARTTPAVTPLHGLLQADLLVVSPGALSPALAAALGKLPGVVAEQQIDAARIQVDGKVTAVLGVDPSAFRAFAAQPTADSASLWENVAAGDIALSYTMGTLDKVPADRPVRVAGRRTEELRLAGLGTVGIAGVDGVVSDAVARSLGIPVGNAIVISAPKASLSSLMKQVEKLLPPGTSVAPLVAQAVPITTSPETTGADGPLTDTQVVAFLKAAESRLGLPYVWGGDGPDVFDCSGLVQWSMAQAGIVMPRVAADQALTGPHVPVSQLQPGDLLFYHTDPTAPDYISHVAIYLGDDVMLQAPEPGLDVEAVQASFGSEFAFAVQVYPEVAAAVAAEVGY